MFDCFLAQMLVLIMIFFSSTRIFFFKNERIDSFAVFAPLSLIISILIFVCFGFSIANFAIFIISLLTFFTNFRAILRLKAELIVDHYSPSFIIFSIISILLVLAVGFFLVILRPVRYSPSDFNTTRKQYTLTGTSNNLRIRENFWTGERFSGNLFVYEPINQDEINEQIYSENPIIIFVPGIRASVQNYEPYLLILAQKGYKVVSADFYTKDFEILPYSDNKILKPIVESKFLRRFFSIYLEETQEENFKKILEKEKSLVSKKYSALSHLALELFGDETKFYYIVDNVDFDTISNVIEEFSTEPYSNAKGFFSMNRVPEYETNGYGFIEQTDVLLAKMKGIERENKFFIPRYVANKTIESIPND